MLGEAITTHKVYCRTCSATCVLTQQTKQEFLDMLKKEHWLKVDGWWYCSVCAEKIPYWVRICGEKWTEDFTGTIDTCKKPILVIRNGLIVESKKGGFRCFDDV